MGGTLGEFSPIGQVATWESRWNSLAWEARNLKSRGWDRAAALRGGKGTWAGERLRELTVSQLLLAGREPRASLEKWMVNWGGSARGGGLTG